MSDGGSSNLEQFTILAKVAKGKACVALIQQVSSFSIVSAHRWMWWRFGLKEVDIFHLILYVINLFCAPSLTVLIHADPLKSQDLRLWGSLGYA